MTTCTSANAMAFSQVKLPNASVLKEYLMDWRGQSLLQQEGIAPHLLPPCFKSVEVMALNKYYYGIGVRNSRGGMEFFSSYLRDVPVTVNEIGMTYIPRVAGHKFNSCCVFADFMDYLAFLTLRGKYRKPLPECDCVIMGNMANFMDLLRLCKKYEKVYNFFPFTLVGRTMGLTVNGECRGFVRDYSHLYEGNANLHQYIKTLVQ